GLRAPADRRRGPRDPLRAGPLAPGAQGGRRHARVRARAAAGAAGLAHRGAAPRDPGGAPAARIVIHWGEGGTGVADVLAYIRCPMRPQILNPAKLAALFRAELELCAVKAGETIALLSDLAARREYVAAALAAADELGAQIYELGVNSIPSWHKVGVPTVGAARGTLDAIKAADLLVCLHIPLFTKWLAEVRSGGTRVLMIIDAPDQLAELMSPPGLKEAVIHAGRRLEQSRGMRVVSDAGTDLTVRCGEYPVMIQYGFAE